MNTHTKPVVALDIVMTDDGIAGNVFTLQPTVYHDESNLDDYEAVHMDEPVQSDDLDTLVIEVIKMVSNGAFSEYQLRDIAVIYDVVEGDMAMFSWEKAATVAHNLEHSTGE